MAIVTPSRPPASKGRPRGANQRRLPAALGDTASAWLAHPLADIFLVVVPVLILLLLGALMVWSASSVYAARQFGDAYYFVQRHLVFLVVALVAGYVASRLPLVWWRRCGWLLFGVAGLLLALTFTPLGYGVGGNKNWLNLGGSSSMIRLQPAEIAKLAIIVWGAGVLATKRKLLDRPKHLLMPFLPFSLLLIALVVLQKDLGTALILGALLLGVLWCVGAPLSVLGVLVGVIGIGAGILVRLEPSRMARIFGFLDPAADPTGVNHQPIRALYGLATGGLFGVGLGGSRQKWGSLSEAHTDYVLAIVGEELGLVFGTLLVLGLFVVFGWGAFRIALRSGTFYGRLVASGVALWILVQALVNVMVVLRLLPVLGVPLPFVSYGGSALLANLVAVGLLVACAREEPGVQSWLARRRRAAQPRGKLSAVLPGRSRS